MVPGPERDADERSIALERDLGDRGQRAIASGHAENVGRRGPCKLRDVLPFPQDTGLDA